MTVYDLKTMKETSLPDADFALALGCFDGVHIGHAALLKETVRRAEGRKSAAWSFSSVPSPSIGAKHAPHLTTSGEKLEIFASLGLDYAIFYDFDAVKSFTPEEFFNKILRGECHCTLAVCGFNFRFGRQASGDANALSRMMSSVGGETVIMPAVMSGGTVVSSSAVRDALREGDAERARELLGRPFSIDFPVVHGRRLGRTLGLPTINQNFPEGHIIPCTGIYCCRTEFCGNTYNAVSNVGFRPTVDSALDRPLCETHIIDFSGDLYGERVRVSFYKRLRGEIKFPDTDALRRQVLSDIESAKEYFSKL